MEYTNQAGLIVHSGPIKPTTNPGVTNLSPYRGTRAKFDFKDLKVAADTVFDQRLFEIPAGCLISQAHFIVNEVGVGAGTIDVDIVDGTNTVVTDGDIGSFTVVAAGAVRATGDAIDTAFPAGGYIRITRTNPIAGGSGTLLVEFAS